MKIAAICAIGASVLCAIVAIARHLRQVPPQSPGLMTRTETDLASMFIFVGATRLRMAALLVVAANAAVAWMLGLPALLAVFACAISALSPRLVVRFLRHRWRRRMASQLPDALALWAGLLRAGQAMAPALAQLAQRQGDPLGSELRLVLSQYRLGVSLDAAVAQFRDRSGVLDLRMLATLLRAQRELGGNLAEALERLAAMLRNRLAMEARIHSLTAQGRLQGLVVGLLPLLLALVLSFMEPVAMKSMLATPAGWVATALVIVLEIAGFIMIRRIVDIDV